MAEDRNIKLIYTSVDVKRYLFSLIIHQYATDYKLKRVVLDNISLFVNLSTDRQAAALGDYINSLLPLLCEMEYSSILFSSELRSFSSVRAEYI